MTQRPQIIDAHQHFWDVTRPDYAWLSREPIALQRSFNFEDLQPHLTACGVTGTVLVQAADTTEDTIAMLDMAAAHPEIWGVVGYAPLEHPESMEQLLAALQQQAAGTRLCGIRNLIHDQPDPDWLLRPDVAEGLSILEREGMPFDFVAVQPRHLEHAQYLSERFPALRIVINHLAKPPVGAEQCEAWRQRMATAARNPNIYAKVSGLYTIAGDPATREQLSPWLDAALELFGPERLMIGSDWPIAVAYGGYEEVVGPLVHLVSDYGADVAGLILSGTAISFYQLVPPWEARS